MTFHGGVGFVHGIFLRWDAYIGAIVIAPIAD